MRGEGGRAPRFGQCEYMYNIKEIKSYNISKGVTM